MTNATIDLDVLAKYRLRLAAAIPPDLRSVRDELVDYALNQAEQYANTTGEVANPESLMSLCVAMYETRKHEINRKYGPIAHVPDAKPLTRSEALAGEID